jgi:hypothetical protein
MEVTRILDLTHFSGIRGRFIDLAFKNSSRLDTDSPTPDGLGGISVFETLCACPDGACACICKHIATYYGTLVDDPCAFWTFDLSLLDPPNPNPKGFKAPDVISTQSPTGDDCHRNIHNVEPKRADGIRKNIPLGNVTLCINGTCEQFTLERAVELQELRKAIALELDPGT